MFGNPSIVAAPLVILWGLAVGTVPVSWTTWFTRNIKDEAESAGGLRVASIQMSITAGAASGGLLFDAGGSLAVFVGSAVVLLAASVLVFARLHPARNNRI